MAALNLPESFLDPMAGYAGLVRISRTKFTANAYSKDASPT
jgi:hypothetical protein